MRAHITAVRGGRKALTLGALTGALLTAALGLAADRAAAAATARVEAGTLIVTGDDTNETFVLRLQAGVPTVLEVDMGDDGTADFGFDLNTLTAIRLEAGDGDDTVRNMAAAVLDKVVTVDGGDGNDTLFGGLGEQTLLGGRGNDVVNGGDGNDRAFLGAGDDRFTWNPGDDSDVIEGEAGSDLLDVAGNGGSETIGLSANGSRARFTRDIANISHDLDDIERVEFRAAGGTDTIVVENLAGTDLTTADFDLGAAGGGGDALADTVVVKGTDGADSVTVGSADGKVVVSGFAAEIRVAGGETLDSVTVATLGGTDRVATGIGVTWPGSIDVDGGDGADSAQFNGTADADTIAVTANGTEVTTIGASTRLDILAVEQLAVRGLAGGDTITAVGNLAPLTALTFDGGEDNDSLHGGNGADQLLGGAGNDDLDGNQGVDEAFLGRGDDRFEWDPGDGNDTVEGEGGIDTLDFFGSSANEEIAVSASGKRVRLTRNIANINLDAGGIEALVVRAHGGTDTIVVNDLTGTTLVSVDVGLNLFGSDGGDAMQDTVVVNGTSRRDTVQVTASGAQVAVAGLAAGVRISGGEPANDTLLVQTHAGDDAVTVAADVASLIAPLVDLGSDE